MIEMLEGKENSYGFLIGQQTTHGLHKTTQTTFKVRGKSLTRIHKRLD